MKGFEPVTLGWGGEEFTVPADKQLMLIAEIEETLAGRSGRQAVDVLLRPSGPSMALLSQAYGTALRYAGATVSDDEIYLSIMDDFAEGKADNAAKVQAAIMALLAIVAPPIARALAEPDTGKKPQSPGTE